MLLSVLTSPGASLSLDYKSCTHPLDKRSNSNPLINPLSSTAPGYPLKSLPYFCFVDGWKEFHKLFLPNCTLQFALKAELQHKEIQVRSAAEELCVRQIDMTRLQDIFWVRDLQKMKKKKHPSLKEQLLLNVSLHKSQCQNPISSRFPRTFSVFFLVAHHQIHS